MAYSVLLHLKDVKVLIVGGGRIALRKAKLLVKESADITVVSPRFQKGFKDLNVRCIEDVYRDSYLDDCAIVFCATDDKVLNEQISQEAKKRNILVNDVSNRQRSTFTNMRSAVENGIVYAASTQGQDPAKTKEILGSWIHDTNRNQGK